MLTSSYYCPIVESEQGQVLLFFSEDEQKTFDFFQVKTCNLFSSTKKL